MKIIEVLAEEARAGSAAARRQLRSYLEDEDPAVRSAATDAFTERDVAGEAASEIAAALELRLGDEDAAVRTSAIEALLRLAPDKRALAVALLPVLNDPDAKVRLRVVEAWRMLDQGLPEVLAAVHQALHDLDGEVRCQAVSALAVLEQPAAAVRALLELELLQDPYSRVRVLAICALHQLAKADDADVVQALRRALDDDELRVYARRFLQDREAAVPVG